MSRGVIAGAAVALFLAGIGVIGLVATFTIFVGVGGNTLGPRTGTVGAGQGLTPGATPEEYRALVEVAAQTCTEVTAPLIAAQIIAESGWNPAAVSPAGAQGLTQFIPSTWAVYGVDGNMDGVRDPFDPEDAIPAQARYMCQQVRQVRENDVPGDVIDNALAAYNAGFGAVLKYRGVPPFSETRAYVPKIRRLAEQLAASQDALLSGSGPWVAPVSGRTTSTFGPRGGDFHQGIDIAGPVGTPVLAAADGVVLDAGPASGYGQWVRIDHGGGLVAEYGHIATYDVQPGQRVTAGQVIATRGNEGVSTGPHLHFELQLDDAAINPESFYQAKGLRLP